MSAQFIKAITDGPALPKKICVPGVLAIAHAVRGADHRAAAPPGQEFRRAGRRSKRVVRSLRAGQLDRRMQSGYFPLPGRYAAGMRRIVRGCIHQLLL